MTTAALLWGYMTYTYAPIFFWWLLPVVTGLVLAAPLVRYSSSLDWGRSTRAHKIFISPDETSEDPVLTHLNELLAIEHPPLATPAPIPELPADNWTDMPHREMDEYVTVKR
jgi:membrane glycosyltransferase